MWSMHDVLPLLSIFLSTAVFVDICLSDSDSTPVSNVLYIHGFLLLDLPSNSHCENRVGFPAYIAACHYENLYSPEKNGSRNT